MAGKITYPVAVSEDENPDFRIQFGATRLGVEVVEAVDPAEQARWTEDAREDATGAAPAFRELDLNDGSRAERARACVESAYKKKRQKCGTGVDALVLYLNTQSALFEAPDTLLSWLRGSVPGDTRFRYVWMVHGTRVYDVGELILLATLERP